VILGALFEQCYFNGKAEGTSYTGGLVGVTNNRDFTIKNCIKLSWGENPTDLDSHVEGG